LDALLAGFLRCVNNFDRGVAVAVDLYQWNSVVGSDLRKRVKIEIICRAGTALLLARSRNDRLWHIASFRCDAEVGYYRGIADIDQAAPITLDL